MLMKGVTMKLHLLCKSLNDGACALSSKKREAVNTSPFFSERCKSLYEPDDGSSLGHKIVLLLQKNKMNAQSKSCISK